VLASLQGRYRYPFDRSPIHPSIHPSVSQSVDRSVGRCRLKSRMKPDRHNPKSFSRFMTHRHQIYLVKFISYPMYIYYIYMPTYDLIKYKSVGTYQMVLEYSCALHFSSRFRHIFSYYRMTNIFRATYTKPQMNSVNRCIQ